MTKGYFSTNDTTIGYILYNLKDLSVNDIKFILLIIKDTTVNLHKSFDPKSYTKNYLSNYFSNKYIYEELLEDKINKIIDLRLKYFKFLSEKVSTINIKKLNYEKEDLPLFFINKKSQLFYIYMTLKEEAIRINNIDVNTFIGELKPSEGKIILTKENCRKIKELTKIELKPFFKDGLNKKESFLVTHFANDNNKFYISENIMRKILDTKLSKTQIVCLLILLKYTQNKGATLTNIHYNFTRKYNVVENLKLFNCQTKDKDIQYLLDQEFIKYYCKGSFMFYPDLICKHNKMEEVVWTKHIADCEYYFSTKKDTMSLTKQEEDDINLLLLNF